MGNQLVADPSYEDVESTTSCQDTTTDNQNIPGVDQVRSNRHRSHHHVKSHVRLIPLSGSPKTGLSSSLPNMPFGRNTSQHPAPDQTMYHLNPGQSCTADKLTEEEQTRMAQRVGLIQHLPRNTWDEKQTSNKKVLECCICMIDFEHDEPIRYLPCMHYYHVDCIDDWLMRSFTCPTCLEPVDAALLSAYDSQNLDSTG